MLRTKESKQLRNVTIKEFYKLVHAKINETMSVVTSRTSLSNVLLTEELFVFNYFFNTCTHICTAFLS